METATPWTHPRQREITYGGHFFRIVDMDRLVFDFGHVPTLDQHDEEVRRSTHFESDTQMAAAIDLRRYEITFDKIAGTLHADVANRLTITPQRGQVHRSGVWPIRTELFFAAKRASWDSRSLSAFHFNQLREVVIEWTRRWSEVPQYQRPFRDFVDDVEKHMRNLPGMGLQYLGYNRAGDRQIVLRFGSEAGARVGHTELQAAMFHVKHVGENALSVMDRSEQ